METVSAHAAEQELSGALDADFLGAGTSTLLEEKTLDDLFAGQAAQLTHRMKLHRQKLYKPGTAKVLRTFTPGEVAKFVGVDPSYLRKLDLDGPMPKPATDKLGRRQYTVADMNQIRTILDQGERGSRRYSRRRRSGEKLQVLSVINFKGGSGKTTTAAHLSQDLALKGYRVLGLDLDPQASFTALHGIQPELDVAEDSSLYSAIRFGQERRKMADLVLKTYFDGLDIVPGNTDIQDFEHDVPKELLARQSGRQTGEGQFYLRLKRAIDDVADDYDLVVIDCPPQMGYLTMAALAASTSLIITIHPAMVDVMSMSQFLHMTADYMRVIAQRGVKLQLNFARYLVTRFEPGDAPQADMVKMLRDLFGEHVLQNPVLKSTAVADAYLSKQTLYEVGREAFTRSTYDRAMDSFAAVNGEIEGLVKAVWGRV